MRLGTAHLAPASVAFVLVLASAGSAHALPRFSARTGNECIQCHVNPSGGGVRNSYGRNIFERAWLPWWPAAPQPGPNDDLSDADLERIAAEAAGAEQQSPVTFSGDITPWLAVGADMRASYFWLRPDHGATADTPRDITATFFLMEAYLYLNAKVHENVQFVLQIGPYAGFEAWGLYTAVANPGPFNLMVKVGHFYPSFGVRMADHQLYTRQNVGLGNADRDTGIEVTGYAGPVTAQLALVNGTFGDTALDVTGPDRRSFEKGVVGRLSVRLDTGWLRMQVGGGAYYSMNNNTANPLFTPVIPRTLASEPAAGIDELRADGFLTASVGRFTYVGDIVWVRDDFYSQDLPAMSGYASMQQLAFIPIQGVDVLASYEFMDPNIEIANNPFHRLTLAVEMFPVPFTEVRIMGRRLWTDVLATGGSWDVAVFVHIFM